MYIRDYDKKTIINSSFVKDYFIEPDEQHSGRYKLVAFVDNGEYDLKRDLSVQQAQDILEKLVLALFANHTNHTYIFQIK